MSVRNNQTRLFSYRVSTFAWTNDGKQDDVREVHVVAATASEALEAARVALGFTPEDALKRVFRAFTAVELEPKEAAVWRRYHDTTPLDLRDFPQPVVEHGHTH